MLKNGDDNLRTLAAKEDTYFYMWSGLDLEETTSIDERIYIIRPLLLIFCKETVHQVLEIGDKENQLYEDKWQDKWHKWHPLLSSKTTPWITFRGGIRDSYWLVSLDQTLAHSPC